MRNSQRAHCKEFSMLALSSLHPEGEFIADRDHLHYRHRVSPYLGENFAA